MDPTTRIIGTIRITLITPITTGGGTARTMDITIMTGTMMDTMTAIMMDGTDNTGTGNIGTAPVVVRAWEAGSRWSTRAVVP
jgi:hypothetical protein